MSLLLTLAHSLILNLPLHSLVPSYSKTPNSSVRTFGPSSGTTQTPKPIEYTKDWAATYVGSLKLPALPETTNNDSFFTEGRLFVMMPPFHVTCLG
jgi:hypothetical protein